MKHFFQPILALMDTLVSDRPVKMAYCWPSVVLGLIYCAFTIIYCGLLGGQNEFGHNYIYPILDFVNDPLSASVYTLGSIVLVVASHLVFVGLENLRAAILDRTDEATLVSVQERRESRLVSIISRL